MPKMKLVLAAATVALMAAPELSSAQSVGYFAEECGAVARQYFGVRNARAAMQYNGARVDGTETVGGDIYLQTRSAYIACAFPKGSRRMSEFFVDGRGFATCHVAPVTVI